VLSSAMEACEVRTYLLYCTCCTVLYVLYVLYCTCCTVSDSIAFCCVVLYDMTWHGVALDLQELCSQALLLSASSAELTLCLDVCVFNR
jgi:hypothetical protein